MVKNHKKLLTMFLTLFTALSNVTPIYAEGEAQPESTPESETPVEVVEEQPSEEEEVPAEGEVEVIVEEPAEPAEDEKQDETPAAEVIEEEKEEPAAEEAEEPVQEEEKEPEQKPEEEESEEAEEPEHKVITSFTEWHESNFLPGVYDLYDGGLVMDGFIYYDGDPLSYEAVKEMLPKTLTVMFGDEQAEIKVKDWVCDDFSEYTNGIFRFVSVLDYDVAIQGTETGEIRKETPAVYVQFNMDLGDKAEMHYLQGTVYTDAKTNSKTTASLADADKKSTSQKNYQLVNSGDNIYMIKSAEWTDIEKGKAKIQIAVSSEVDPAIPYAVYAFSTCVTHGLGGGLVTSNINWLLEHYNAVDVIAIDGPNQWGNTDALKNSWNTTRNVGVHDAVRFTKADKGSSVISTWANGGGYRGDTSDQGKIMWRGGNHYTRNLIPAVYNYVQAGHNPSAVYVSGDYLYDANTTRKSANTSYAHHDAFDSSGMLDITDAMWTWAEGMDNAGRFFGLGASSSGARKMDLYGCNKGDKSSNDGAKMTDVIRTFRPGKGKKWASNIANGIDWDSDGAYVQRSGNNDGYPAYTYAQSFGDVDIPAPLPTLSFADTVSDKYTIDSVESNAAKAVNGNTVTITKENYSGSEEVYAIIYVTLKSAYMDQAFANWENTNTSNVTLTQDGKTVTSVGSPKLFRGEKKYTLTINYLEEGTNNVLAKQHGSQHKEGEPYSVASPAVDHYHLVNSAQATVKGTMPGRDVTIDVYYRKNPNLTIMYLEQGTEKVLADQHGPREMQAGSPYDVVSPAVENYSLVDPAQDKVSGTMPDSDVVVKVYYSKNPALTIQYLEKDTEKVLADQYGPKQMPAGTDYKVDSPSVKNYHLVSANDAVVKGKMPAEDTLIKVYYELDPTLTVRYLEKDTDKVLADQYGPEYYGIGSPYSVISPDVENYHLVKAEEKTIAGEMPAVDTVIDVYYEKDPTLTVRYLDKADDHPLAPDNGPTFKKPGTPYEIPSPKIENYLLDKTEDEIISGVMPNEDTVIIVYYVQMPDPVKSVFNLSGENINGKYVEDGEEIHYVISVENPSSETKSYVITDVLPEHTEFVSADKGGELNEKNTVVWHIDVPAGESAEVSFNVKAVGRNVRITNIASVTVDEVIKPTNEVNNATPDNSKTVKVDGKDVEGKFVAVGTEVTYDIAVKNILDETKRYIVTDAVPAHTAFVSADNDGELKDGIVEWDFELEPGESVTLHMTVVVTEKPADIANQAWVCVDGACEITLLPVITTVPEDPIKDVVKVADGESINKKLVNVGDEIIYEVFFKNTSKNSAHITVADPIPEDTEFVEAYQDGKLIDGEVVWDVDAGPGEECMVSFKVKVLESAFGKIIRNKAFVGFVDAEIETNETENPVQPEPVKDVLNEKGVSINGKFVAEGQKIRYAIEVENTSAEAVEYEIRDTLDEHLKPLEASDNAKISGQEVSWKFQIPANTKHVFTIDAEVSGKGVYIPNEASVKVNDLELKTNKVENWTPKIEKKILDKDGKDINEKFIDKGQEVTYEIKVENPAKDEREFTVTDTLPEGMKIKSASDEGKIDSRKVDWAFKLAAGASKTLTIKAEAEKYGTELENEAILGIDDLKIKSNKTTNWTPKEPVKAVKDKDGADINGAVVGKGEELHYEITVENNSKVEKEYKVTDVIPVNTEFVSADNKGAKNAGKVEWTFKLPAGEKKTVGFVVKTLKEETHITNKAIQIVDGIEIESNEVENWTMKDPVKDVVDKDGKSINKKLVRPGDVLTYTITFKNPADSEKNAVVTDKLPEFVEFVSADKGGKVVDGKVTWEIKMAKEAEITVSFKVKVKAEGAGKKIVNKANVAFDGKHPVETNEVFNPVQPDPIKAVVGKDGKSLDGQKVSIGTALTFTITVKNPSDEEKTYTITDKVEESVGDLKAGDGGKVDGRTITWTVKVKAGGEAKVSFTGTAQGSGVTIRNKANVSVDDIKMESNEVTVQTGPKNESRRTGVEGNLLGYEIAAGASFLMIIALILLKRRTVKAK